MDWVLFVGHCLLGFSQREIGFMTLSKFLKLYKFYKNHHDFETARCLYSDLDKEQSHAGEWLSD